MRSIDYTGSLEVGGVSGFFVNKILAGSAHVFYVAYGTTYQISPFDEFGEPYSAEDMFLLTLAGEAAEAPLVNVGVAGADRVYLVKSDGAYTVTSDLDSVRSSYQIVGDKKLQLIARVEVGTVDEAYDVDTPGLLRITSMDIPQVLRNTYLV